MSHVELLEHLVSGVVSQPDAVEVSFGERRGEPTLVIQVDQVDRGAVIGRQGRTIRAIETVLQALNSEPLPALEVVDDDL